MVCHKSDDAQAAHGSLELDLLVLGDVLLLMGAVKHLLGINRLLLVGSVFIILLQLQKLAVAEVNELYKSVISILTG